MKEQFKVDFAIRLNDLIESQKRSRSEVAKSAGVKYATLASYLNNRNGGKGALPPLDVAVRLADALGVSLDNLCGRDCATNNQEPKEATASAALTTFSPSLSEAQQALMNLYLAGAALNCSIETNADGGAVLRSDNHFVRMFLEAIQSGADLHKTIDAFAGIEMLNGELLDRTTYQLTMAKEQKL